MAVLNGIGKSATNRKILKYLTVFGGVESLTIICSVVRTKLVALYIGVTGVGLLGLFTNAVELLSTFTQMGLRMSAVKEISSAGIECRASVIRAVIKLSYYLSVFALLVSVICAPLMSYISFGNCGYTWAFLLLSVVVVCNLVTASRSAILQALARLKSIARASVISMVLALGISIPLIVYLRIDAIVPMIMVYSVVNMCVFVCQRTKMPESGYGKGMTVADASGIAKKILRLGAYLMISSFVTWLASYLVLSYMNYAGGSELMGYYQSGYTLTVRYAGIVFTAMSMEYFPRLAACEGRGDFRMYVMVRHQSIFTIIIVSVLACAMMVLAPWVVGLFYSNDFESIVPLVILASPGLLLRGVSWCMAFMILAKGDGRVFLVTELVSAILCLILNVIGYSVWGIAGIGASFTIWYVLYALIIERVVTVRYGFSWGKKLIQCFILAVMSVTIVCAVTFMLMA